MKGISERQIQEKQLQEKMMVYRTMENRINSAIKQREMFAAKVMEVQSTITSIDEIKKGKKEMMFPIGAESYAPGKIDDTSKLVVEIGAGVAIEKTPEEAKEFLESRKKELEGAIEILSKDMENTVKMMQRMEADMQKMIMAAQQNVNPKFKVVGS